MKLIFPLNLYKEKHPRNRIPQGNEFRGTFKYLSIFIVLAEKNNIQSKDLTVISRRKSVN